MSDLRFLSVSDVQALHEHVMLASNQNATSLVRREALESAVHSARYLAWYQGAGVSAVAAHLAVHIAVAHPWVDGNKRTAATSGILFARYNGARQATADEALQLGQLLIKYVESSHEDRVAVFKEFVELVDGWFD